MSKNDSGDFFGDMIKLWGAVQASKGSDGKPDPYKAAGIAAGLGHSSMKDFGILGAMLGSEGAFDDDNASSGYFGGGSGVGGGFSTDDSWRDLCEDGSDYGIDPEDYETEYEYEEALEEAKEKYAWRENCEDGFEYNVDPEDYETEEEYLEALNDEKYAWRDFCDPEADLDPEDYETEEEYQEALEELKEETEWELSFDVDIRVDFDDSKYYAWRDKYYGFNNPNPADYETEDEYIKALEQEFDETIPIIDNSCSYDWRENFKNFENIGVNPNDFDNKEDFIHDRAITAAVKSAEPRTKAARNSIVINEETLNDKTEYIYCGVVYEGNDFTYHYLTYDESIKIGDKVIVPVGNTNEEVVATVVSVGKYLRVAAPYPLEKTKKIIRKE